MRIATYTRISTDEDHQPYSLEAQAAKLKAYADSQDGWKITRRFSDQASGATLERPGLERALREAEAKRFDLLLVYRVDRLSRSVRRAGTAARAPRRRGRAVSLGHRAVRHLDLRGADDGADARRVRRVRARHDRGAGGGRHGAK